MGWQADLRNIKIIAEAYGRRQAFKGKYVDDRPINVFVAGRTFGRWIDYSDAAGTARGTANGSANNPGYNEGALIEQPAYVIESLFRDELFVERDLKVNS